MAKAAEARPPRLEEDELVQRLLSSDRSPHDVKGLYGYLGRSDKAGSWRLYKDMSFETYVEIAEEDVIHAKQLPRDQFPLGGTAIWVKADQKISSTGNAAADPSAFLRGAIATQILSKNFSGRLNQGNNPPGSESVLLEMLTLMIITIV